MLALSDWVASGPLNPQTAPFRVAPMFTCSRCLERVCFMHHSASLIGKNFDSCLENDSKTSKGKCAPCLTFHLNLEVQPAECWSGGGKLGQDGRGQTPASGVSGMTLRTSDRKQLEERHPSEESHRSSYPFLSALHTSATYLPLLNFTSLKKKTDSGPGDGRSRRLRPAVAAVWFWFGSLGWARWPRRARRPISQECVGRDGPRMFRHLAATRWRRKRLHLLRRNEEDLQGNIKTTFKAQNFRLYFYVVWCTYIYI